jgi:NADPH:quinone reductase-like Zn-dependent oxidoreductase
MWGIQMDECGGPEGMEWRELPEPEPEENDVIVQVEAAGLITDFPPLRDAASPVG